MTFNNIAELERKLCFDGGFLATFNDQEACRDESLEFITVHHPIIKAIKGYYDANKQDIFHTAQFLLRGKVQDQGKYLFFIYLLEKTALKKDLVLVPILVNLGNKKVHIADELCDWFLGEIVKAEISDKNLPSYDEEELSRSFKDAGEYLEMLREEEEQKIKRSNDTLVNNQIESVKQATAIKIRRVEEIIKKLMDQGKTEEDPIVRLYRGRIRNFGIYMTQKIKELEQKKVVSVAFNLIAGGVVQVE